MQKSENCPSPSFCSSASDVGQAGVEVSLTAYQPNTQNLGDSKRAVLLKPNKQDCLEFLCLQPANTLYHCGCKNKHHPEKHEQNEEMGVTHWWIEAELNFLHKDESNRVNHKEK